MYGLLETKTEWFTLIVISVITIFVYKFHWRTRSYFSDRNIKCIRGLPFIGVFHKAIRGQMAMPYVLDELYHAYPNEPIIGVYNLGGQPNYIIRDPELIKQIAIKNFDHFPDHNQFNLDEDLDPFYGRSLGFINGQKWRDMRSTVSPTFTSSKMRLMFSLLINSTDRFIMQLKSNRNFLTSPVNLTEIFRQFVSSSISTCVFGLDIDSFPDGGKEFINRGRSISDLDGQLFKFMAYATAPNLMKFFRVKVTKDEDNKYFRELIMSIIRHREQNLISRHDMISLLLEMKNGKVIATTEDKGKSDAGFASVPEYSNKSDFKTDYALTDDDMVAQVMIFFIGGLNTLSISLSFMVHELAMHPEIQQRLYEEIISVEKEIEPKGLTYEQLNRMKYLDCVLSESLRRWSPLSSSDRSVHKSYELNVGGGRSVLLRPGDVINIPNYSLQMDPKYFPNPERFDPDRFSDDHKNNIDSAVYMPFGIGPRNCVASRFALMEMKCFVYYLLREFQVEPCPLTRNPLRYLAGAATINVEGGFWAQFKQRNK